MTNPLFYRSRSSSLEPKKSTTTRYLDLSCLKVFEELSNGKAEEDGSAEVAEKKKNHNRDKEKEKADGNENVCLAHLDALPEELLVCIVSQLSAKELLSSIQLVNKR